MSNSLDSLAPRKRRRTSPALWHDEDSDNGNNETLQPLFEISVPSRIRRSRAIVEETKAAVLPPDGVTVATDSQATFESLNVNAWLVRSLAAVAIQRPTSIQKRCIPEILKGRDCIGGSRTGSGKTAAFAVPILQRWAENPSAVFAVVLTPTRELALQLHEQFKALAAPHALKTLLVTGGSDMRPQAIALAQNPHLVIATPGRLADHVRTSGEDTVGGLKRIKLLVLDEADQLLAAGRGPGSMLPDVEECLSALPPAGDRQTLLFTATVTPEVRALKNMPRRSNRPSVFVCEVDLDEASSASPATQKSAIPATLVQALVKVPVTHREHYLHALLSTPVNAGKPAVVFTNRTSTADMLHRLLRLLGHRVTSLHGALPQRHRIDNLARFRARAATILVATDVASRGLDIPEVGLVVNYDIPRDPDTYIHRVGRTARAGRTGNAVTLVGQRDVDLVLAIEERVGRQMDVWAEEGVNLETRVMRHYLQTVSETKREALLEMEEGSEVGGKRKMRKVNLRAR